jgi:hypothetical protein
MHNFAILKIYTIISRPFVIIIIFEYTYNMVVRIHSKYTFINILHPIIFF